MTQQHHATLAHHVPGRLRIKIAAARGNPALLETLGKVFEGVEGIDSITVKPDSGSIVLHYDPALESEMDARFAFYRHDSVAVRSKHQETEMERLGDDVEKMAKKIEAEAEFLAQHSDWARAGLDLFKDIDRQLRILTNNTIDLKIVLALSLAVITFVGIGAEAATPMWVTLALFALNHFMETHTAASQHQVAAAS